MVATRPIVVLMAASSPWSQLVVEYLTNAGFPVQVVDFNPPPGTNQELADQSVAALCERVAGVHIFPAPRLPGWRLFQGAWQLRGVVHQCDAQMVLTLYGGMQAAIAWLSGVRPYALYVVGSDVLLADRVRRLILRLSMRGASLVLANGEHLAAKARQVAPGVPIEHLYLGINLKRFHPPAEPVLLPRFVCTRAFDRLYDNAAIVRAVATLPSLPPDFALAFLSSGPLLQETIALADRLIPGAPRAAVSFAGGVSDTDLVSALRSARFYLSASHSDGASASLLEAMACGLLPIVSDIPANREWIVNRKNGLLFPAGDHEALARAMAVALEGAPWIADAVESNSRLVAERADVDINLRRLSRLLSQDIARHAAARAG